MSNGPEFSWEYGQGGSQGNNYSQMGMNGSPPGGSGGRQWLHSNQANAAIASSNATAPNTPNAGYMQGSGQNAYASPGDPFAAYNQSMMNQYTNYNPTYGHSQLGASMVNGIGQDPGQGMGSGMSNGMGNGMGYGMGQGMEHSMGMDQGMSQGMGQGMSNGQGAMGGDRRLSGGLSRRSNGLGEPAKSYRGSWF